MIDPVLIEEYEFIVGPVNFTLAQIAPEDVQWVEQMMREVIAGKRPPLTDRDLGIDIPPDAES